MHKLLTLPGTFSTGEATLQPVLNCSNSRFDYSRITKQASEALDYIKNVTPEPGKTHMLVLALGASETYGPNRNGDAFSEYPVKSRKRTDASHWVSPGEELTKHYKTFENGHAFKHHVNKDPAKASGVVKKAFFNPKMHRVELLICIDNDKDPEWVSRVNDGDFPAVSMGCRIKHDVCSICGNKAPTRSDYCDHVKYAMNQVNPDGTKNFVYNPSPDFFDISRVFRPADRTGYTLKKVAFDGIGIDSCELGEYVNLTEKISEVFRKMSDICKILKGTPVASKDQNNVLSFNKYLKSKEYKPEEIKTSEFATDSFPSVLAALSNAGILLTTKEFIQLVLPKLVGSNVSIPDSLIDHILSTQHEIFDAFASSPELLLQVTGTNVFSSPGQIPQDIQNKVSKYVKRASITNLLKKSIPDSIGVRNPDESTLDLIEYTDPRTGKSKTTTRGAVNFSQDAEARDKITKGLGASALLLGAYNGLSLHPELALALGGTALATHGKSKAPPIKTEHGLVIPQNTEFSVRHDSEKVAMYLSLNQGIGKFNYTSLIKFSSFEEDPVKGKVADLDTVVVSLGNYLRNH